MKHPFYILLYLIIYTALGSQLQAQSLELEITAEHSISKELKDSLQYRSKFKDYLSLKKQIDTLTVQLQNLGYIDSYLEKVDAINDSLYRAHYFFGRKYNNIKIYYSKESFNKKQLSKITSQLTDTYFIIPFEAVETSLQKLNSRHQ